MPVLETRLLPLLDLRPEDPALQAVDALESGGVPIVEVALRRPGAMGILESIIKARPSLIVGAGTVRTPEQAHHCIEAGCAFLVSPGLSEDVARVALDAGIPVIPGVATATEVMRAVDLGLTTVKLFPASVLGGPAAVRALSGPFPDVRFVPTGGIDASSATDYLAEPSVAAVGGSWMVAPALLAAGDFEAIRHRTASARDLAVAQST